uniref:Uncharacterized protein n=1 Tax=Haptolina ericina TaxID=156174 RepID=A0A7S3BGE7_9EUKA
MRRGRSSMTGWPGTVPPRALAVDLRGYVVLKDCQWLGSRPDIAPHGHCATRVGRPPFARALEKLSVESEIRDGEFYGEAVDMLSLRRERLGGQRLSSSIDQMHLRGFGLV